MMIPDFWLGFIIGGLVVFEIMINWAYIEDMKDGRLDLVELFNGN